MPTDCLCVFVPFPFSMEAFLFDGVFVTGMGDEKRRSLELLLVWSAVVVVGAAVSLALAVDVGGT